MRKGVLPVRTTPIQFRQTVLLHMNVDQLEEMDAHTWGGAAPHRYRLNSACGLSGPAVDAAPTDVQVLAP